MQRLERVQNDAPELLEYIQAEKLTLTAADELARLPRGTAPEAMPVVSLEAEAATRAIARAKGVSEAFFMLGEQS